MMGGAIHHLPSRRVARHKNGKSTLGSWCRSMKNTSCGKEKKVWVLLREIPFGFCAPQAKKKTMAHGKYVHNGQRAGYFD